MRRASPLLIALTMLHVPVAQADTIEASLGGTDQPPTPAELTLLDALKRNHPEATETQTRPRPEPWIVVEQPQRDLAIKKQHLGRRTSRLSRRPSSPNRRRNTAPCP